MTPASDRPPPNSSSTPQGSLLAVCQSSRKVRSLTLAGIRNSNRAAPMAMLVSFSPGRGSASSGWKIQASAARVKIRATSFSWRDMGPSAAISCCSMLRLSPPDRRKPPRVSHHQVKSSMPAVTGTPSSIHWPKPMCTSWFSRRNAASSALGGVPISVAMPPTLAA